MAATAKKLGATRTRCPVCNRLAHPVLEPSQNNFVRLECPCCGLFETTPAAAKLIRRSLSSTKADRMGVSARIRHLAWSLSLKPSFDERGARKLIETFRTQPLPLTSDHLVLGFLSRSKPKDDEFRDLDAWCAISDTREQNQSLEVIKRLEERQFVSIERNRKLYRLTLTSKGETLITDVLRTFYEPPESSARLVLSALEIEESRCFGTPQRLQFSRSDARPSKWTILIGQNGVGKTTILQAIALLYPRYPNDSDKHERGLQVGGPEIFRHISRDTFIRSGKTPMNIDLICRLESDAVDGQVTTHAYTDRNIETLFSELGLLNPNLSVQFGPYGFYARTGSLSKASQLPLLVAYGATRVPGSASLGASDENETTGSENLFSPNSPLRSAEEWLLKADYAARFAGSRDSWSANRLRKVRESILRVLPDVTDIQFLPPEKERPQPTVRFVTRYGDHGIDSLSLGYQTTLAWVVDLSARLFDHYPDSINPLSEPVLVLIDEIDLHLHPKWQRKVMEHLDSIFTGAQFVVTTHSPLIVQSIPDANLVVLKRNGSEVTISNDHAEVRNWRVDQILTSDLFELSSSRSPQVEKLLAEERSLKTKSSLSDRDRTRLRSIESRIGNLPVSENSDQSEAMDIIFRAAAALKK